VTTLAGSTSGFNDGTGSAAQFTTLGEITITTSGNLYVADQGNHRIRQVTPAGVVTTFAGNATESSTDGTGTAATFDTPYGLTSDSAGNLYVADVIANLVRMITPAGVVTTLVGSGALAQTDGVGTAAAFDMPLGLAIDQNNLVIASGTLVRKITRTN
jgi:hypothetical protein